MKKDIIIDVGANQGGFSLEIAKRNPDKTIYAFEPEPGLVDNLNGMALREKLTNHIVIDAAITLQDGESVFNVSKTGDFGTSSLMSFDLDHLENDSYWSERSDLKHIDKITVKTMRLDSFLENLEFNEISFLKIDAQGLDVEALLSCGKYINKIQAGMLEVPAILANALYVGEAFDLRRSLNVLEEKGFTPYAIKPNDHAANEYNLFFVRKGVEKAKVEEKLNLRNFNFYDGKHFWHLPSNRWINYEERIKSLDDTISALKNEIENYKRAYLNAQESYDRITSYKIIKFLIWLKRLFK